MPLNEQESEEYAYAQQVKLFIESEAWQKYGKPQYLHYLNNEFPKPDTEGWEEKYRYAHALVTAGNTLESLLINLADRAVNLAKKSEGEEIDIDLA